MDLNRRPHRVSRCGAAALSAAILFALLTGPVTFQAQTIDPFVQFPPCAIPPAPPGTDTWPMAVTDILATNGGASVTFSGATLLANDTGDSLILTSVGPGSSGGGTVTGTDPFTFTFASGFVGTDIFPYEIRDRAGQTAVGLVKATANGDTIFPSVSIASPASGDTVSGTVVIRATASDNIGVAGVQFFDGINPVGLEVTSAPFEVAWNTSLVANGDHSLSAAARDGAGNTTPSLPIVVVVSNVVLVTVPDVVGKPQSAAESTITGAGLTVAVTGETSATVAAGNVIRQSPAPGESAVPGSRVDLVVSSGPPAGLVLSLSFDTVTDTTVNDASGLNNHGTIRGALPAEGKVGGGLQFDGVDDWVTVLDSASLDLTTGMTIEAWVNPTALNGWDTIVMKQRGAGDLAYALYAHDAASGPAGYINAGGEHHGVHDTPALTPGVWTHLAATYDGSMQHLYINGALAASRAQTGNIATSTAVLRIGGNGSFAGEFYAGRIDEMRVYNRALTATQINADMKGEGGSPPPPPPPPPPPTPTGGLVLALGLNEAAGSLVANDSSGGSRHGTVREAEFVEGKYGSALSFDGVNDWVTVPDSAALDLTAGMTIEAWVKPGAINGWETVVLKERGVGDLAYGLYAADGTAALGGADGPAGYGNIGDEHQSVRRAAGLTPGIWVHLAITYDGSMQRLYIDGGLVASRAQTGNMAVSASPLRIGGNNAWAGEFFNGLIDEVRVYNRALSADEIETDKNTPLP